MFKGKLLITLLLLPYLALAQVNYVSNNIFQTDYFIENRGQFDYQQEGKRKIFYSTEMPFGNVFFHKNGFSIKQKKAKPKRIHEQPEYDFAMAELMEKTIHLEWLGTNPNCELIQEQKSKHYFSFGPEEFKSYGYKKLTYKNIYPNIDIVYTIEDNSRFHYSILLHKGAKVSDLKMKYHNVDVSLLKGETSLELQKTVFPVYEFGLKCNMLNQAKDLLTCIYALTENGISFKIEGVNVVNEEMEIDPWVASLTTLTGDAKANQKGYDVDNDYKDNLFVYGGGFSSRYSTLRNKLAKYNSYGNLLWTFNCTLPSLNWFSSDVFISNFTTDKLTGKVYVGEGYNSTYGTRIIRLDSNGIYDSYISTGNKDHEECWDLQLRCQTGDIVILGGSTSANISLSIANKQSGAISSYNLTGISTRQQDIACSAYDTKGQLYIIFASVQSPIVDNRIYKLNSSLSGYQWASYTGYKTLIELDNKLDTNTEISNGYNCLSANSKFLFYYDGKNLKAFNQTNGTSAGNPLLLVSQLAKKQGGIESDDCNNVYVGGNNGNILIYNFDGVNFNFIKQIVFQGQNAKPIYDLKKSKKSNKIFVSGQSFVAETYLLDCDTNDLITNIYSNCIDSAFAELSNPLIGTTYDFIWYDTSSKTVIRSKLNSNDLKDTLVLANVKTYKLVINRNSVCLPSSFSKYVSFKHFVYDTVNLCSDDSFKLGQKTFFVSGIYLDTVLENGCLKITQFNVYFHPITIDTIVKNLCMGDTVVINAKKIDKKGIYKDTFTNRYGCDSIVIFKVKNSLNELSPTNTYDTICFGTNKVFNDLTLTTSGIFLDTVFSSLGCDSFLKLNLKVRDIQKTELNRSICHGQSVQIGNKIFNSTGTYVEKLKDIKNCDSIVTLNLKVNPNFLIVENGATCKGVPYRFFNQNLSSSGVFYQNYNTIQGCDSIYELRLKVGEITGMSQLEFCKGDSAKLINRYVKTTGDYYDTFKLPSGCDSFHLTRVNVIPWGVEQLDTVLCYEDSFKYKSQVYTKPTIIRDTIFSNYKTTCHKYKFIYLDFKNCDTMNECNRILLPTGFTPNNDGINDKLSLIVKSDKIKVTDFILYNRWGQMVYNYFDDKNGWDGIYKGEEAPAGVYSYKLKYLCKGQIYEKAGSVTLLR